jgi:ankyrin repeat protein
LRAKYQPVIASFFYSAREGERETSHQHMLQTLLCEVLAHEAELYPHFQESYRRLRATSEGQITWSYNDLKGVFIRITSACEKTLQIYFLIDALDESDRTELLDVLLLLKNSSKASTCVIKILLASRPNEMISKALTGTFRVILEHENKQDIIALVNTKLAFLREPDDTSVFEWTSKYLNEHAQGVFLWVSLIAQELEHLAEGGYSELDVKDMVQKFPIELIDYYKRMIKQLAENGQHVVTEAREMLDWACYTERPLTAIEMRDIIAISSRPDRASTISVHTFETSKLRRLADVKKRIRRNCGDLLEIKKQRSLPQSPNDVQSVEIDSQDVVQLLHQTAREFLIRADKIAQPFNIDEKAANNTIGLICAHYIRLSFAIDEAPVNGSTLPRSVDRWTVDHHKQLLAHLETRPLLHYALKYLPYHLDRTARSSSPAWRLIDDYFHRANENLGFVWYYLQEWFERLEFSRMPVSSLEAMTEFRITGLVAGIKGRTLGAVQALSEVQRNLDHVDCYTDHTALQTAASCGDSATLVFLINNGASVNFHGGHFGTALQAAAYHGHNEVVTILLERGADPNSEAGFWSTAFLGAACSGHENIAKILLNHGSDTYFSPALLERLSSDPGQLDVVGRSSISVFSAIIGSDHTATLNVINSLALAYGKQGQWKKAETMQRRALKGYEEALGPEHPDTLISIKNLGLILERQGKYEEAEAMQRRALEVMERVLGTEHPDTLISMRKLGSILESQGKYKEAESM